jgi:hypothetical protein
MRAKRGIKRGEKGKRGKGERERMVKEFDRLASII